MIAGFIVPAGASTLRARTLRLRRTLAAILATATLLIASPCRSAPLPQRDGIVLYRKKCGSCHRPYAPSEIKTEEWEKTLAEMKRRAKLTDDEVAAIRRYVEPDLVRSHGSAPPPR